MVVDLRRSCHGVVVGGVAVVVVRQWGACVCGDCGGGVRGALCCGGWNCVRRACGVHVGSPRLLVVGGGCVKVRSGCRVGIGGRVRSCDKCVRVCGECGQREVVVPPLLGGAVGGAAVVQCVAGAVVAVAVVRWFACECSRCLLVVWLGCRWSGCLCGRATQCAWMFVRPQWLLPLSAYVGAAASAS